jgi:hypothetical protein
MRDHARIEDREHALFIIAAAFVEAFDLGAGGGDEVGHDGDPLTVPEGSFARF